MNKKVFNLFFITVVLGCGMGLFSCTDSELYDPGKNPGENPGKNFENPSLLDFATSQTVKLHLNYRVAKGVVTPFDVYTEYPLASDGTLRTDVTPVAGGIHVAGTSEITRVIPSHIEKLYVYSPHLFVPLLSVAEVINGVASFSQMDVEIDLGTPTAAELQKRISSSEFLSKPISRYLKKQTDFYSETTNSHYKYDLINPDRMDEIPSEVLTTIGLTFPENKPVDPRYLADASITLSGKCEVYITPIHSGASFSNSLSYIVYEGAKELNDLTEEEKMELEIINILPFADLNTNTIKSKKQGLTPGHSIQLLYKGKNGYQTEFPENAKIAWVLHSDAFNESDFSVKNSSYRVFSPPNWNDPKDSKSGDLRRTVSVWVEDKKGELYHCVGFEDQSLGDEDCNDLIFVVHSLQVPTEDQEIKEPEDVEKTEQLTGVLAFEDKWPRREDYDLNDIVVQYSSKVTYVKDLSEADEDATVSRVDDVFSFIHTGAAYRNAFSYKVNVDPNSLHSLKINGAEYQAIPDGEGFIIDLCPNVKEVIVPFEYGTTPAVYTVTMEFIRGKVLQTDFAALAAPYNPFIVPLDAIYPNTEIHLPMYPPTNRAERSQFGTEDDCSDQVNLWYVSGLENQYPFAIHLAGVTNEFIVPLESKTIDVTYPRYINWVESNMTQDKDWYLYPEK